MWRLALVCTLVHDILCGRPFTRNHQFPLFKQGRVIGGSVTDITQVPYLLQLEQTGSPYCGASLISPNFALTAAHCTDGRKAFDLQIRYGSSQHATGGATVQVVVFHQHPLYNQRSTDFDVSVLALEAAVPFGKNVQTISLAENEPSIGEYALVSGWGVIKEGTTIQPFQLQSVMIPVSNRSSCNVAYENRITSRMFCAGLPNHDSCQGDSGGPLVANGVQIGIVSWGYGCARRGYPGIYSNIAVLRRFIDTHTQFEAKWVPNRKTVQWKNEK